MILSPYWVIWYTSADNIPAIIYCFICLLIGLQILRYADDEKMPVFVGTIISLYGFFIAATWIDTIASNLVGLLQFLGTISRIPSSILGITILAWGNSMGDLSANLAMARKGMPDMATTVSFTCIHCIAIYFYTTSHTFVIRDVLLAQALIFLSAQD